MEASLFDTYIWPLLVMLGQSVLLLTLLLIFYLTLLL